MKKKKGNKRRAKIKQEVRPKPVSVASQEMADARKLVEQLRANQQEAQNHLLFAQRDSQKAQKRFVVAVD